VSGEGLQVLYSTNSSNSVGSCQIYLVLSVENFDFDNIHNNLEELLSTTKEKNPDFIATYSGTERNSLETKSAKISSNAPSSTWHPGTVQNAEER